MFLVGKIKIYLSSKPLSLEYPLICNQNSLNLLDHKYQNKKFLFYNHRQDFQY